jgi:hypothetical protein
MVLLRSDPSVGRTGSHPLHPKRGRPTIQSGRRMLAVCLRQTAMQEASNIRHTKPATSPPRPTMRSQGMEKAAIRVESNTVISDLPVITSKKLLLQSPIPVSRHTDSRGCLYTRRNNQQRLLCCKTINVVSYSSKSRRTGTAGSQASLVQGRLDRQKSKHEIHRREHDREHPRSSRISHIVCYEYA